MASLCVRQGHAIMIRGSCLCGAIRFAIDAPLLRAEHCHCQMCRKAHGAAFSTNALVSAESLHIQGKEHLSAYRSSPDREKLFCSRCGSQLFIKRLNAPESMIVTLGTVDGDPHILPSRHVFYGSKAPWFEQAANLPIYGVYPGFEPSA